MDLGQLQRVGNFLGLGGGGRSQAERAGPTIRIGLIGASQVSTYAVVWPSRRLGSCEVVAVASRDADRAAAFARQHGIPRSYGSYDSLLLDPEVDAVYVGLPNGLHGLWSSRALGAGKHVLCEKPFAANEAEARQVHSVARRRGLLCREAFHYREHPLMSRLQQLVALPCTTGGRRGEVLGSKPGGDESRAGVLGHVQRIDVKLLIPKWVFGLGNIRFMEDLAGGAMMDAGCYCAHVSRTLAAAALGGAAAGPGAPLRLCPLTVTSAAAKLRPGSSTVDGAMIVNWTTAAAAPGAPSSRPATDGGSSRRPFPWLRLGQLPSWLRPQAPLGAAGQGGEGAGAIQGRYHASLQHNCLLPITEISVTGTRGSLLCKGFIVPFFGHVIHTSVDPVSDPTSSPPAPSAPAAAAPRQRGRGRIRSTERAYGEGGETTYHYQLKRFVEDLQLLKEGSSAAGSRATMHLDMEDSVANMKMVDEAYLAAGLQPRQPSAGP